MKWVKVEDEEPENYYPVLLFSPIMGIEPEDRIFYGYGEDGKYTTDDGFMIQGVTHWLLPLPPEEK